MAVLIIVSTKTSRILKIIINKLFLKIYIQFYLFYQILLFIITYIIKSLYFLRVASNRRHRAAYRLPFRPRAV